MHRMNVAIETPRTPLSSTEPTVGRLTAAYWVLAIVLGFVHMWAGRHQLVNADAMSYLDLADAFRRGDWQTALSAYWSPLYPALIALGLVIVSPSSYWKFTVLHLVNFAIYLLALACFALMIRELNRLRRRLAGDDRDASPDWVLVALGYPIFIWSTVYLINPRESPDLLVAMFVYLAGTLVLRTQRQPSRWIPFALLGVTLGFGFLAKAIMLPMSAIVVAVIVLSSRSWRRAVPRAAVTVAMFLVISGPFVLAISEAKGRLTFGESGRLNYLWSINRIPQFHWQGEQSGHGMPTHPTRRVLDAPPIYEFATPVSGTYPPWFDPTYWYEGSVSRRDVRQQLNVLGTTAQLYYDLFQRTGVQYALAVGLLTLSLARRPKRLLVSDVFPYGALIVPALLGLAIYATVWVHGRYVAPFLTILWLCLFAAVRLPSGDGQRLIRTVTVILMALLTFTVVASGARETAVTTRSLIEGENLSEHVQWQVAEGVRALGISDGDRVAVIGSPLDAYWAHLAGVRIVAELPAEHAHVFWNGDSQSKNMILQAFASTGAKAVVVREPPVGADRRSWLKIRETNHYISPLK